MKVKVKDKSGRVTELHPKVAQALVEKGRVFYVAEEQPKAAMTYQTRALQASPVQEAAQPEDDPAPYGYKADGTPRKRPGRPAAAETSSDEVQE